MALIESTARLFPPPGGNSSRPSICRLAKVIYLFFLITNFDFEQNTTLVSEWFRYLGRQVDAAEQVGQDRDGGQGDQDGADHMAGDPAGDSQQQRAGAVHHFL